MSAIKAGGLASGIDNFAMPINEAIAMNNESVSSIAIAHADQIVILEQTDTDGCRCSTSTPTSTWPWTSPAPVDAAVAANANVAAPVDAAVSANVLSFNSDALAQAPQDSVVVQDLDGVATATAIQDASIDQSDPAAGA